LNLLAFCHTIHAFHLIQTLGEPAVRFFVEMFKWVMLVSGLLTITMVVGLFSPHSSTLSNFGETLDGPLAEIIVRNWSALIFLMGVMLVYGAFVEPVRKFALVIAGVSKIIFITLVLTFGSKYLGFGAGTAVIADSIMVVLYAAYLFLARNALR
jgi:hypothetical protein